MKTIMVVGAGKSQVPLILAAKKENYHTVVCDIDLKAPGVVLADEYFRVSTKDRFALYGVAKDKHIDGIVANSEYAMCDVSYIANCLGLIGNPEDSIAILSSKSRFRVLQKNERLFAPDFLFGESIEKLKEGGLSFPVIIKPDQNSGTRGTMVIGDLDNYGMIQKSVTECTKISRNTKAIVEEYVKGSIFKGIEGEVFIHKGKILWDGLFLTLRSKLAPMIPMTYVFPLQEEEKRIRAVKEALTRAFSAANVVHGEYNIEMFFTDSNEPFIIEINPRQGGNDLPKYVQESCGIDYYRLLVTTSMGDNNYWNSLTNFKRDNNYITHHVLYPKSRGYFKGLRVNESIKDSVYRSQLDFRIGDEVEVAVDGASCIGYVDLAFSGAEEQMKVSANLEELIKIEIEQKPSYKF